MELDSLNNLSAFEYVSAQGVMQLLYSWKRPEVRPALLTSIDALILQSTTGRIRLTELGPLCTVLREKSCATDEDMFTRLLHLLSIAVRNPENPKQLSGQIITTIVECVKQAATLRYLDAGRYAALAMFRACLWKENKIHCGTVSDSLTLLLSLCARDSTTLGAVCSILQFISETNLGKEDLVKAGAIPLLVNLLYHDDSGVVLRSLSALHELSADLRCCTAITQCGGALVVVSILSLQSSKMTSVAVGIIQNLSRDKDSIHAVQAAGAVDAVTPLLLMDDPLLQSAAVGALLNLHQGDDESRRQLKTVLTMAIVEGAMASFEEELSVIPTPPCHPTQRGA